MDAVNEKARYWRVKLTSGHVTDADRVLFGQWQADDPRHRQAFAYITALDEVAGECAVVVAREEAGPKKRPVVAALAAIAALLLVFIGVNSYFQAPQDRGVYSTEIGEMKEVVLRDGSTVHLSGQTRIAVAYSEETRYLRLLQGRAVFSVEPAPTRPFIVEINGTKVRAVGTEFDIHKYPDGVSVSVIEGIVSVTRAENPDPVVIEKGQQLAYSKREVQGKIFEGPPERFATWQKGFLEFNLSTLDTVVADVNRYAQGRIIIEDDALRDLPVTAVFVVGDFEEVADLLEQILPVRARKEGPGRIILTAINKENKK